MTVEHQRVIRFLKLLPHVFAAAMHVEIALRRRPIDQLSNMLRGGSCRVRPAIPAGTIERAIRFVYRVLPLEWTCLKHALIFGRIRRSQGLSAELRIGVRKSDGVFGAHAWIEDGFGNVLTNPLDGFKPIPLPQDAFRDEQATD